MAVTGVLPKAVKHGRNATIDWTEVPDTPFLEGARRELPVLPKRKKWHPEVVHWWEIIRVMPHARLWEESDWLYARHTAFLMQAHFADLEAGHLNTTTAVEIRRREDNMGTSVEARRKIRIRYVDPQQYAVQRGEVLPGVAGSATGAAAGGTVVPIMSSRRAKALEAAAAEADKTGS